MDPDFVEAHTNLGMTLQELGRLEEAEASYREATAMQPDYAEAHFNFGIMLKELGRYDDAETSLRVVLALEPNYTKAHNHLLECLYMQDKKTIFLTSWIL